MLQTRPTDLHARDAASLVPIAEPSPEAEAQESDGTSSAESVDSADCADASALWILTETKMVLPKSASGFIHLYDPDRSDGQWIQAVAPCSRRMRLDTSQVLPAFQAIGALQGWCPRCQQMWPPELTEAMSRQGGSI